MTPMHKKNHTIPYLLALILPLVFSCHRNGTENIENSVFRYNESSGISGLDPAFARTQSLIWPVYQIFNGLVEMDNELKIIPSIAKSWEIVNNGKTYNFYLRRDVRFHDHPSFPGGKGRRVTASDFVYSFERIITPQTLSPGSWVFSHVDKENSFVALNDSTLQINLSEAFAPFLGILTMPYCFVVPREAVQADKSNFARYPCGTGPFQFKYWRDEEKLVLIKNENYFEKDSSGISLPYLEAVSISFIKDKQSEFMEFLLGNLDYLSGMYPIYKDELITRNGELNPKYLDRFRIISQDYLNTEYLAFLLEEKNAGSMENPLFNPYLRKAINYGFDRKKMIKYLRNNIGSPATGGFIPKGMTNYNPYEIKGYDYNPDTAEFFMEKAGYPGGDGLDELLLTTTSDYVDLCEFIQFELRKLGINLKIEVATGASFRNKVINSNLNFFRASWIADYPDPESYLSLFYSGNFSPGGPNYTHFNNSIYDSLYILSNSMEQGDQRNKIIKKMDQMIIDEAVIVPLFYDQVLRFVPKGLNGFESNPMNIPKLKFVSKSKKVY